ncbi:MAG: nicotinate (nicotinamide) nucleotide adenylyltransferase [Pseudomonadota bacterium]|nr:nicotinate (nicotinamide) nucleotide adenylyltransferase [Pseudomonadota bacterium]
MRVAIYGGSFNPPHVGHAMVASWIRWTGRADAVWLLPAYHHAFEKVLAPWEARVRMAQALADTLGPWCRVERIEEVLPVPSYTVNTLGVLAARHPQHELQLVVGADVLSQLPQWREVERLLASFPLIVVGRQGWPAVEGAPCFPDVSSTEIRERVAIGAGFAHLVPTAVRAIVDEERLYRSVLHPDCRVTS